MFFQILNQTVCLFQLVAFTALFALAQAGNLGYGAAPLVAPGLGYGAHLGYAAHAAPVAYAAPIAKTIIAEPSAPAHYDFGYAVSDPLTGDHKSQQETRRGDVVQGNRMCSSNPYFLLILLLYIFHQLNVI